MTHETKDLSQGKKRGIREIPAAIKSGTRMTKNQLRFFITAAVTVIAVLFIVMTIAGNRADDTVTINEEVNVLLDASSAERILVKDGNFLEFEEGYTWSGTGTRTILNEKITTSKNYWITLSTESEIAEYEQVIGEGRFLKLAEVGKNSLWLVMGKDDEIAKVNALDGAALVPINNIRDNAWLQKGTDDENKAAEAAFGNIRFIQFEKLGSTHIRLRRGMESEITKIGDKWGVLSPISQFQIQKVVFKQINSNLHFTNFNPFSER